MRGQAAQRQGSEGAVHKAEHVLIKAYIIDVLKFKHVCINIVLCICRSYSPSRDHMEPPHPHLLIIFVDVLCLQTSQ